MSPSRGVRWSALFAVLGTVWAVRFAAAQTAFDDPSPFFEGSPDVLARSPRLLALGRLTYLLDDAHNRITLWDLGQNPVGVIHADSTSTLEFGPTTGTASSITDRFNSTFERQTFGGRDFRTYYEAWRRVSGGATYGAVGDWSSTRSDQVFNEDLERRVEGGRPNIMPILAGRLPMVGTDRVSYALRALIASPNSSEHYRELVRNAAGEFVDQNGTEVDPPDAFEPVEFAARSLGIGAHFGVHLAPKIEIAAGYDYLSHVLKGTNEGFRHASEVRELRPYHVGQVTIAGKLGSALEWGADARGWRSKSNQTWVFTTSAGTATDPLSGRGKLLDRKEEGSTLRARIRWNQSPFEVGAGVATAYRKVDVIAPTADDISSLNHFIDLMFLRTGADTLALPDSIVNNTVEDRSWDAGGAVAWNAPWARTLLGVEGHYFKGERDQALSGAGPRRLGWDGRMGAEYALLSSLKLRGGFLYRWEDRDDFTADNEYITESVTGGLGFQPGRARWVVDAGYAYQWTRPDFDAPTDPRTSQQRLAARIRWVF